MKIWRKRGVFSLMACAILLLLCLTSCETAPVAVLQQQNKINFEGDWGKKKAVVVIAVDLREKTILRDNIRHVGSVFFRRVDNTYDRRAKNDYDFAIQYTVSADWKAVFGQRDENRTKVRAIAIDH
jgi:hypothetical protein